jgi:cbb3-type cytochrome oxidase subunit 3
VTILPLLSFLAHSAAACAVCMPDKAAFTGIWWGIVLLLSVTMAMVAGIAWMFWRVEKSRAAAEARG